MPIEQEMHVTAAGVYEHVLNELIPVFTQAIRDSRSSWLWPSRRLHRAARGRETVDVVLTSAAGIDHLIAVGWPIVPAAWTSGACALASRYSGDAEARPEYGYRGAFSPARRAARRIIDPKGGGTSEPFIAKLFERLGVADH